jgi:NDP-sugar pyrophosphorylase family protein
MRLLRHAQDQNPAQRHHEAVIRSPYESVSIGAGSAVLETSVVIGPATIGSRTVFGHRCLVVGAQVGDLCEIGNGSILLPGSHIGHRVFLGVLLMRWIGGSDESHIACVPRSPRLCAGGSSRLRTFSSDLLVCSRGAHSIHDR